MVKDIRIGTRGSTLALVQANWVAERIRLHNANVDVEIEIIKTSGDKLAADSLVSAGGKGLFVKEIETALLESKVDIAVHSMKDLPMEIPEGLCMAAIPERAEQRDALVTPYLGLAELPGAATVGSGSPRRRAQLKRARPDLRLVDIRGNVDTRLKKLDWGEYDAVVLACAGLERLGLGARIRQKLPFDICLPAVGQGALAIEARCDDKPTLAALKPLDDPAASVSVRAERALLSALGGGCLAPIGAVAVIEEGKLRLIAMVADADGGRIVRRQGEGSPDKPEKLGEAVAAALLDAGAREILQDMRPISVP